MSAVLIGAAMEAALDAMSPSLATARENGEAYEPVTGTPYQKVNILFARPENPEISRSYQQRGFMQVTLMYPINAGAGVAGARAELIRSAFYRSRPLTSGSVTVTVEFTPEIMPGVRDGDRYAVPVRVPFFADIPVT